MTDRSIIKAETFAVLLREQPIEIKPDRIFQYVLCARDVMKIERQQLWAKETDTFRALADENALAFKCGSYRGLPDFGHTSANTKTLLTHGFRNIPTLVREGTVLRQSAEICFNAMADYCLRLADQDGVSPKNAEALRHLAAHAPRNLYEGLQLLLLYFYLHEFIAGTRMRTLGRLDEVIFPLYQADRSQGMTYDQAKELLKAFMIECWEMKVPYDLPFCIGGTAEDGTETTNELSELIVDAYRECNIHSPKIHVRVSAQTPTAFIKKVLSCIRDGISSFVFINDAVGIPMMQNCGATLEEARSYVLIGCYEPAIFDKELPCTGTGSINLPKALELVFLNGYDLATGNKIGLTDNKTDTFDDFYASIKAQICYMVDRAVAYVCEAEKHYMAVGPDPILSALLSPCAQSGVDAFAGGAKYNNSSLMIDSPASLVDGIYAVKKLVYDEKKLTFDRLRDILISNWDGHEELRRQILNMPEKYGNNIEAVDAIAADLTLFCADYINSKSNARGGFFKASNFSIDQCFGYGKKTMATPDGRKAGEPLSKNMGAVTGMDRKGLTALIQSAVKTKPILFPNGSVLDFVLHPSAVAGDDGLDAFLALLQVYFAKGGFAMQGNVFRAEVLKDAQANPEKYANLQVRVCGWNVFFVNLSKAEQDAFIKQAEATA